MTVCTVLHGCLNHIPANLCNLDSNGSQISGSVSHTSE